MKVQNKKNILFISFNDIDKANYGGSQCSIRNINTLIEIANIKTYSIKRKSKLQSINSAVHCFFPPFSAEDNKNILSKLKKEKFDYIFYDSSLLGSIIKNVSEKFNIPSILFFHNVEVDYINVRFGKSLIGLPYKLLARINERKSITYSDKMIVLNNRDKERINMLYKRTADSIIPITFSNKINKETLTSKYKNLKNIDDKICLFVGAFGNSNYQGIRWFIEEIAPQINAKFRIVGKGFERVNSELSRDNVEVIGFVENIQKEYLQADCVISPLLFGAGMKVKIAEALMYGKTIFGTNEAFEGYEIDYGKVGGLCNTAEEFINKINEYLKNSSKYNDYSRHVFEANYTDDIAIEKFKQVLESLDKK